MDVRHGHNKEKLGDQMTGNNSYPNNDHEVAEQKLWRAVIAGAVDEWMNGPLRRQREAEQFLFQDNQDYRMVCFSAGIDPNNLRNRLEKIRISTGSKLEKNALHGNEYNSRRAA
jgi:hypothetical protein